MSTETKIVKGGFRATLALIIAIIALILAVIAFNRSGGKSDLNARIKDLQTKMEKMKSESAQQMDRVREETSKALEKLGEVIKKKTESEQ